MADYMEFPNDWAKFLEDYSFRDHKEFYTNGARLIPTFRVEQMMHHYLRKATEDSVVVVHGRWIIKGQDVFCSSCNNESGYNAWGSSAFSSYCPNCGAKMDGEGRTKE